MNDFQQIVQQFQQFWARQTPIGRLGYGFSALLVLLAVLGVGFWVSRTEYAVLYTGLTTDQAAPITQKLDADRISYKLSTDGTTILVPVDRVQKTRMILAVGGLLHGNDKGFEILDAMSMGTSPFLQGVNYNRAIQGELAKSIMTLEPIQHARVHIVQPEPTPFVRDEQPTTASVVIKTRPGTTLARHGAQAIVALVAGSVRGLMPENVTVLDAEGRVLSEKKKSAQGMASTEQLAHQLEVESHLATKAQEILTRLLGPGRAVVRVTADMTFRHVKESSEKFDPDGRVALRESSTKSKTTAPTLARGPAGTTSNQLPPPPPNAAPVTPPGAEDNDETTEYAVTRSQHSQEEQQENINRLTVSVILIPPKPIDEVPLKESLGITEEDAAELVKRSVGFKAGRDEITVSFGKAADSPAEEALDKEIVAVQQWQNIGSALRASSLGVAALSLLAIGLLSIRRKPSPSPTPALALSTNASDLDDLHAVAGTIRAWLEEPANIRMDRNGPVKSAAT